MATIDEMMADLEAADSSGDFELAGVIADRIRAARQYQSADVAPRTAEEIDAASYAQAFQAPGAPAGTAYGRAANFGKMTPAQQVLSSVGRGARQGLIQVGKGMHDVGVGVGQLGADVLNLLPGVDVGRSLDVAAEQSAAAAPYMEDFPGGVVGPIAGGMAATLPLAAARLPAAAGKLVQAATKAAPTATRIAQAGATGAAMGAIEPTTAEEGRLENIGEGAAAGAAFGAGFEGLGRVITPISKQVDAHKARMIRLAENMGIRLTPGQKSGNVPLKQLEDSLSSNPLTSGPMARLKEENQKALNKATAASFGEDADQLTEEVIDRAFNRIGNTFDTTTKGLRVAVDDNFRNDLGAVMREYQASLPSLQNPKVAALVDDINKGILTAQGTPKLKGEMYQKIVSDLSRIARSASRGENADMDYARALLGVKEVFDDAAARSMPEKNQQAFRQARREYRNLMAVVNSGAVKDANVYPKTLKAAITRRDRAGMARGRDQSGLARVGKVGEAFQPIVGDSGTATRMSVPLMAAGGGGAAVLGSSLLGPAGAVLGPAAAAGGANLLSRAYLSDTGRAYLTNSLLDELSRSSLTRGGGLLGVLATQ